MKINKKIAVVSVAALMGVSPLMGQFILPSNIVSAATKAQTVKLTFGKNSYVYNRKGQRLATFRGKRAYFKKKAKISVRLATSKNKTQYYYYDKNGNKTYLKVYKIKGKKYFGIGNGGYVNINNFGLVGYSSIYTDANVKVVITKNVHTNDINGLTNDQVLKKGTVITVDGHGEIPGGGWVDSGVPETFYRIAGTNTYFIDQNAKLKGAFQTGKNFQYLLDSQIELNHDAALYSIDGKEIYPDAKLLGERLLSVDCKMYLYVPSEKKTELFYHITDNKVLIKDQNDHYEEKTIDQPVFIKVDDASQTQGAKLSAINTASEAEADNKVATETDKNDLSKELKDEDSIKKSIKYTQASAEKRSAYDYAISFGKKVNESNNSTINEVKLATWSIKTKQANLNGESSRVKVAYENFLSANERSKILHVAKAATTNPVKWTNHNRNLVEFIFGKNQGNRQTVTTKHLNIKDYLTAVTPKIKNKKGYDSSATDASIKKDKTLAKYAKMLDFNMRKEALVASRTTPIYLSTTKIGVGSAFNVNKINLKKSKKSIKRGNNIGYYPTLVVKIKGQYYFMIQEGSTYFVKAADVKLDNFSTSETYKKYQEQIDKLMGSEQLDDFSITVHATKETPVYDTNDYFAISKSKRVLKKGQRFDFDDPYVVKYNGQYFITGGEEFNSDYDPEGAVLASDVTIGKAEMY